MGIEFDPEKSERNRAERGFGFELAERFEPVLIEQDRRRDYGEARFRAFGFVDDAPYALAYTPRGGNIRIISMRRMHDKEARRYGLTQ